MMPRISVVMPVFNCVGYVELAVNSILRQTFADFEFLIIDDASDDGTYKLLQGISDTRIRLIRKPVRTGYTESLNMGLKLAKGEYIARMDGDDISMPQRFEKQLACLLADPEIAVCGSNYEFLGKGGFTDLPSDPEVIRVRQLSGSCIAHPTAFIRKSFLDQHNLVYDVSCEPAEDYNLWVDIARFGSLCNVAEPLLQYRVHANQTSVRRAALQNSQADKIRLKSVSVILPRLTDTEKKMHLALMKAGAETQFPPAMMEKWIKNIKSGNKETPFFNEQILDVFLNEKYRAYQKEYLFKIHGRGLKLLLLLLNPLNGYYRFFTAREMIRLAVAGIFNKTTLQ